MGLSSLFGPKLPIDGEELEFQLATFKWLRREFGEPAQEGLVTPTPAFFPSDGRRGVETLFEEVRLAAGMGDWACELRAGDEDRSVDAGNDHLIRHQGQAPCGTFQIAERDDGPVAIITWNPDLANDSGALVATFAHELGHYLMATAEQAPPGGWELHELHTDLAAAYLGFGIFLANGARQFRQWSEGKSGGWSSSLQGYLSEGALVTALAIAERLSGRDPLAATPYLKPYLQGMLAKATTALDRMHPDLRKAVEAVDLSQFVGD